MLGLNPTITGYSYMYSGERNEQDSTNRKMKNRNERTETQGILMWKPRKGKTTWSPQTPKQNHYDERSTIRYYEATTLRSSSSDRQTVTK